MTEGKGTNLLKAAKELNIGISTAVDCLVKKGYDVDAKPGTKLSGEMYNVLLKEFQGDKIVKDEAKQIVIGKIRRDESPVASPKESSKNDDYEETAASKDILIKNAAVNTREESNADKKENPVEKVTGSEAKENSSNTHTGGMKVVGKIDLDALKRGSKPKKEETPEVKAETPKEVEKKPEVVKEATPTAPKPIVKEEPKVEVPKAPIVEAQKIVEKAPEAPKVVIAAPQKVEVKTEAPKVQEKKVVEEKPKNEKTCCESTG